MEVTKSKMSSLRQMKNWGMGLVILGIMFGVALAVLGDVSDQLEDPDADSDADQPEAYHAVADAIDAIGEFTGWFGLIVLVVVAGIIISLVQSGFGASQGRRRFRRGNA